MNVAITPPSPPPSVPVEVSPEKKDKTIGPAPQDVQQPPNPKAKKKGSKERIPDPDLHDALDYFSSSAQSFPTRVAMIRSQKKSQGIPCPQREIMGITLIRFSSRLVLTITAELARKGSYSTEDILLPSERVRKNSLVSEALSSPPANRYNRALTTSQDADSYTSVINARSAAVLKTQLSSSSSSSPSSGGRARGLSGATFPPPDLRRESSSWSSFSDLDSPDISLHLSPETTMMSFDVSKQYFLDYILKDKDGRAVFMNFLRKRHCAENLMFWVDVEKYSQLDDPEKRKVKAKEVYERYIDSKAAHEINIPFNIKKEIDQAIENPDRDIFLQAQKSIFLLMVYGTFDYFVQTEQFRFHARMNFPSL